MLCQRTLLSEIYNRICKTNAVFCVYYKIGVEFACILNCFDLFKRCFRLMVPSSRGLGRGPLKAATRVRIPLGSPIQTAG